MGRVLSMKVDVSTASTSHPTNSLNYSARLDSGSNFASSSVSVASGANVGTDTKSVDQFISSTQQLIFSVTSTGSIGGATTITLTLTFDSTATGDDNMLTYDITTLQKGGLNLLLEEDLPAVSSATAIFANAPAGTKGVLITIRGGTLTFTEDGSTPTATHGGDLAAGLWGIFRNSKQLLAIKAIGASVTSGNIKYYGV